jgi:SAM-dependent methyltransferase
MACRGDLGGAQTMTVDDAARNRAEWNRISDEYQALHADQLGVDEVVWGNWNVPEREIGALGDVAGRDVLEYGCGAARFSIKLAKQGARCVGVDISDKQLEHARLELTEAGVDFPLVQAAAGELPFEDQSFDIVFSDHGATTWADPYVTIPEIARLLRGGGLLVFNVASPFVYVTFDEATGDSTECLLHDYFGMRRFEPSASDEWQAVEFQLPYGEWIALFRANGFEVEALIELRPPEGATTTFDWVPYKWARRWPAENIWRVRKRG